MHPGPEVWHEAGHAVVARWQGGVVREVTIESELDDHMSHTEVEWSGFGAIERARRAAMVSLAGPIAEMLETGADPTDPATLSTWRGDWEGAINSIRRLSTRAEERYRIRKQMVQEITAFLRDPTVRERLARVVDALDAHGTLDETLFDDALG